MAGRGSTEIKIRTERRTEVAEIEEIRNGRENTIARGDRKLIMS